MHASLDPLRRVVAMRCRVASVALVASLLTFGLHARVAAAPAAGPTQPGGGYGTVTGRVQSAITEQSLNNARVTIAGTDLVTFTDEAGFFRFAQVPGGPVALHVFHSGFEPHEVPLDVLPGAVAHREVSLRTSTDARVADGVVKLDAFTVQASRETNAEAIAVNEQRFSPNIKSVVAADAFGEIAQGNIGEFIKYLPGIGADFADPNIISITVRGLDSNFTQVTSDGAQLASAHTGGSTRVFQFDQVSLNNVARVELTKVPAPSDPADSLGGVVNLVSKSAFEHKQAQLNYRVFVTGREGNLSLRRLPDPHDGRRHRVLPNADFTYTLPVNQRFGLVVAGLTANSFDERRVAARTYNTSLAGSGASVEKPFLQTFTLQDAPRFIYRTSGSLKADWRVTPDSVLSANLEHSGFRQYLGMNQLVVNTGNLATPAGGGQPLSFGPDFTRGATGRGALSLNGQFYNIRGATDRGALRYRLDNGRWQIRAGVSRSESDARFTDTADGHFYNTTTQLWGAPGFVGSAFSVNFLEVGDTGPRVIDIRDAQNNPVDVARLGSYRLTAGASLPRDVVDEVSTMDANVRRRIQRWEFPLTVGLGAAERTQKRDTRMQNASWTYNGPDGNPATNDSPVAYQLDAPTARGDLFGFNNLPWISNTKAFKAWQSEPRLFTQTAAQEVAAETYRINNSEAFEETVTAAYFESDARLFRSRLRVLAGVRYEKTVGKGQGALSEPTGVYRRDPDGSLAHDSRGNLVRKPEAGAPGSMQELTQTLFERAARAKRSYHGYYPSLHLTWNVTGNFVARVAYAKTYGRPNFNQIIPNATINDFDVENTESAGILGTISLRNPGLRPWSAHNSDVSVEYYTDHGGVFSAGAYYKDIDGFFMRRIKVATADDVAALALDPRYIGYQINTTYNLGRGHTTGVELSARQSLAMLGKWGRWFDVFANTTLFEDISDCHGEMVNAGATFRKKPVTVQAKVNYRGETRDAATTAMGPDAYQYEGARTTVDVNLIWILSRRLSLFASSSNALNDHPTADRRGSLTPDYAKRFREQRFGALYSLGIRGTF